MDEYYNGSIDTIHLKFGRMQKHYNFTPEFVKKYPNFCAEYEKHWNGDDSCRFKSTLEIAQYVDMYDIPVKFYFNFTDTPVKNMAEVYEYLIREYSGINYEVDGTFRDDYGLSLDGQQPNSKVYEVKEVKNVA